MDLPDIRQVYQVPIIGPSQKQKKRDPDRKQGEQDNREEEESPDGKGGHLVDFTA